MNSIFNGDFAEDMETAKRLIKRHPHVDFPALMAIAADQTEPDSVRIAAIYTLNFTDDHGVSRALRARIAEDADEPAEIRDHAAEELSDGYQGP